MSHFSRLQTLISDTRYLLNALDELGFRYEQGKLQIAGYLGQKMDVDFLIRLPLSGDIGLKFVDGKYEVIADWNIVRGISQKDFVDRLTQRYAYHAAVEQMKQQGFTLVEETVESTGQIRLVLRRVTE